MHQPRSWIHKASVVLCGSFLVVRCGSDFQPVPTLPPPPPAAQAILDLNGLSVANGLIRVSGAESTGAFGVPVAGGFDCDNDGFLDYARSEMLASPFSRVNAGQVRLIFGDGRIMQSIDTAVPNANILTIAGSAPNEVTGSEIWMDDVTGDGLCDLLIARQNFKEPASGRIGAGALTILVGNSTLRDLAANGVILDLAAPPPNVTLFTLVGAAELDRLGMWVRTGDVTGDGIADILVGADQEDNASESNRGAAYLIRGGVHLDANLTIDLAAFGATALAGHIAKITPPPGSADYHFGATVALADLDNNGRSEVLIAAALSRIGGSLLADGAPNNSAIRHGGNPGGSLFIVWDDNFPLGTSWANGFSFSVDNAPGSTTRIDGGSVPNLFSNERFGEELLGGLDYDADGTADLFVGDISGVSRADRVRAGVGHVFFSASLLRNQHFSMSTGPAGVRTTTILGPAGSISGDTSLHGDIDGDGIADLAIASPLENPLGRVQAGVVHILWGQAGPWPEVIDLQNDRQPDPAVFAITNIFGANGERSVDDTGDTLMYSAAAADMDRDGKIDLIINEMRGNGVSPAALDVGNLLIISGEIVPRR
ncbi:MAG: FG-GAP repeat protein [Proteobacteria bacterium]|nr:FG-GAP repeat protein [Pseudomonadota bacterium]